MAGGENTGSCGCAVEQIVYEYIIRLFSIRCILIFLFLRKSVGVQPVNQFLVHAQSPESVLGSVDVKVHKPRNDQLIPIIPAGDPSPFFRESFKNSPAFSFFAYYIATVHSPYFFLILTVTDMASDSKSFHVLVSLFCHSNIFYRCPLS